MRLPYGHGHVELAGELVANIDFPPPAPRPADLLGRALRDAPALDGDPLIVVSDITRPTPTRAMVEALMRRYGWVPERLTLLAATGNHPGHTAADWKGLLGSELAARATLLNNDAFDDLHINVGTTARGTPAAYHPAYLEAAVRITTGLVEFHPFAGFSGGPKALMPGISTQAAIEANHRWALEPDAVPGVLEGNRVAEDIMEAAAFAPPSLEFNVALDAGGVCGAAAGALGAARDACLAPYTASHAVEIPARADITVVSAGGHPRDIDFRQASKALDFAQHATRPGGTLVLLAECPLGMGDPRLGRFLRTGWPDLLEQQRRRFELGSQRATHVLEIAGRYRVIMVTAMPPDEFRDTPLETAASLDEALAMAGAGTRSGMAYGSLWPRLQG